MERKGPLGTLYLPSKMEIVIEKVGDDKWTIDYTERFEKELPPKVITTTVKSLKAIGMDLKVGEKSLSFKHTGPRTQIFDMMASEFLSYTTLGQLTLTELMALLTRVASLIPNAQKVLHIKGG